MCVFEQIQTFLPKLQNSIFLHFQDNFSYTPMHIAVSPLFRGDSDLQKIKICQLLHNGYKKELKNRNGHTAMDFQFWKDNESEIERQIPNLIWLINSQTECK